MLKICNLKRLSDLVICHEVALMQDYLHVITSVF